MSIFKRFSDILNSNINAMLDKAEDPQKLVKLIVTEMESTLFEVRKESAKTIADQKEMQRQLEKFNQEVEQWQQRAELAIAKGREDLAKQALSEKRRIEQSIDAQRKELDLLATALDRLDHDLTRLQSQLDQALARRKMLLARQVTVKSSLHLRAKLDSRPIEEALDRFERFEKRLDVMEAEVEAMDLGRNASLSHQIESLACDESLDKELEQLKQKLKKAS
ncbi:MAG: phage shock protein PspA [Enterobacterales bacterium]|nr:phage shock protein PspA [Enterobacterales bacterium]